MIDILFVQFKKLFGKVSHLEKQLDISKAEREALLLENKMLKNTIARVRKTLMDEDEDEDDKYNHNSIEDALIIIDTFIPPPPEPPKNRLILEGSFPGNKNDK